MDSLERIKHLTYALQHHPHCLSPYLIRLCGDLAGMIDHRPYSRFTENPTNDRLFFGKTIEEAIEKVLADEEIALERRLHARAVGKRPIGNSLQLQH